MNRRRRKIEQLLVDTANRRRVVAANKSDLPAQWDMSAGGVRAIHMSAKTAAGLDDLRRAIVDELTGGESLRDTAAISNARHAALLEQAREDLTRAEQAVSQGEIPEEFVLADLQAARARFDEIVGTRTPDDVLQHIFQRFCVGK